MPPAASEDADWQAHQAYAIRFYADRKAVQLYQDHLGFLLERVNSINGRRYAEDPALMAWQ